MSQNEVPLPTESSEGLFPVELEFFIESDGTVVFADLAADVIPVAQILNPDQPLVCDVVQNVAADDRRAIK